MFHDTGIPSPVPDVDFTVRSAALAREFTDSHHVPADTRELVANAIAMHHPPALASNPVPRAYLLSAGAALDVFGLRSNEIPDAVRHTATPARRPAKSSAAEISSAVRSQSRQRIMEPLWSPAVATGGNQWQMERPRKRPKLAKSVAVGCDRLPPRFHGKEGVDGSSPSEGLKYLQSG
jgi:hypothetical protein